MHGHLNVNLSRCTVTWTSIYHDARSPERQSVTMHGHMNVNLSRCTVTLTSIYHDARSPERQNPATCLYPKPERSRPLLSTRFLKSHFNIILPSTLRSPTSVVQNYEPPRISETCSFWTSLGEVLNLDLLGLSQHLPLSALTTPANDNTCPSQHLYQSTGHNQSAPSLSACPSNTHTPEPVRSN